jgi:hypothetical protein
VPPSSMSKNAPSKKKAQYPYLQFFLGCDTVQSGGRLLKSRRKILPPSSGLNVSQVSNQEEASTVPLIRNYKAYYLLECDTV